MIELAKPLDAAAMAQVLGGWIKATPWMPKLHLPIEDVWFCGHLIDTCDVWVLRQPTINGFTVTDNAVTGPTEPDDTVSGFLARRGDQVQALYLAPDARGQGYGKALLDLAKAGRDRLELWTFQANTRAIAFYRREGFTETTRTDGSGNDEKLPDLRLVWIGGLR